jgi:virulence factor Mce-like protein
MRFRRESFSSVFNNPVLIGAVTILVVAVAVYISYIAENGLPFIPSYDVNVQVADGGELYKNTDVRIGGARVGQVLKITPEPADHSWPHPYAQLELQLEKSIEPLPADTTYQVRLASVLGGQYLELFPGHDHTHTVPDGGTLTIGTNAADNHNVPYVDLSAAFDVFGPKTRAGIQSVASDLAAAFAGRGAQLNDATQAAAHAVGPLDQILAVLAAPSTQLSGFISGLASTTAALAPVSATFSSLLQNAATTAGALDVPALGSTLDQLPGTESTGTSVLTNALPVLKQVARITQALKPAAAELPTAAEHLNEALKAAPATLKLLPGVASAIEGTLRATKKVDADPNTVNAFKILGVNDLGTAGASAFVGLGAILNAVAPAQFACNVTGLWARNFASALSDGDSESNWLLVAPVLSLSDLVQPSGSSPSSDLHINYDPTEDSSECQAGNEVYSGQQAIGNPGQTARTVDDTSPPSGVYALGQKAGLVP